MNTLAEIMASAQMLVDQKLQDAALSLIKTNDLSKVLTIIDGKVIDIKDACHLHLEKFITVNKQMLEMKEDVRKLANTEHEVLIVGPTGTGKEIIAQALHGRRSGKFRAVNCAGLPESLVEAELFGYEQGAFTGASSRTDGLMKYAQDGTLFLDEISELPPLAQGKLLRALQSKVIRRVGGKEDITINCRFVCASNKPLDKMVTDKLFRIDLYARVATFELHTIPLAERTEDVIPIYKSYGADEVLLHHIKLVPKEYPFNVRTIQQHIKRYQVLGKLP